VRVQAYVNASQRSMAHPARTSSAALRRGAASPRDALLSLLRAKLCFKFTRSKIDFGESRPPFGAAHRSARMCQLEAPRII